MMTRNTRIELLLAAFASIGLLGQGLTGNLTGSISDQSGAPVAGAEVVLTNVSTNQVRSLQSDSNGDFTFTQLHCCPVRSPIDSVVWRGRVNRFGNWLLEVPVKWAFSRTE